ncbi:MAG TPA: DCC1-like thiol-disulfide oxidoreductase family protein [Planctomycetota bacterium]|nr:DCC1-like thiol-disulfide oxidoreductase family protein [Planctomycetota bacterium]
MKRLTVFYDADCGFCVTCRWWLGRQPAFVDLDFLAAGSPEANRRFPGLAAPGPVEELLVVDDEGGVYRGASAWLMCLWALQDYREWAGRLASPALLPLARGAFAFLSGKRRAISGVLGLEPERWAEEFRRSEPPRCVGGGASGGPDPALPLPATSPPDGGRAGTGGPTSTDP